MPDITLVNTDNTVEADSIDNTAFGTDLPRVYDGNILDYNDNPMPLSMLAPSETECDFDMGDPFAANIRFGPAEIELLSAPIAQTNFQVSLTPITVTPPVAQTNFTVSLTPPVLPTGDIFPDIDYLNYTTAPENVIYGDHLRVDGGGGDRPEIGLFTGWQAEYLATGNNYAQIIDQADRTAVLPWDDYDAMKREIWRDPPGLYGISFSHQPNAFFMPYILTRDVKYVAPMESVFRLQQQWGWQSGGQVGPMPDPNRALYWLTGRDLAWGLRNLGQLAYIERTYGDTVETYYQNALELTRLQLVTNQSLEIEGEFHVYGEGKLGNQNAWQGWFEGYIGHTLNHLVNLGFTEFRPLAEWHIQHLLLRSGQIPGEGWPFKAIDNDVVIMASPTGNLWENVHPYAGHPQDKQDAFDLLPDDDLVPYQYSPGNFFTYQDRIKLARNWAVMAINNGIRVAELTVLVNLIDVKMAERGDTQVWHKWGFSIESEEVITPPVAQTNFTVSLTPPNHAWESAGVLNWVEAPDSKMRNILPPESFTQPVVAGGSGAKIFGAWNGAAVDTLRNTVDVFCSGGHFDYHGNEYLRWDRSDLSWLLVRGPSDLTGWDGVEGRYFSDPAHSTNGGTNPFIGIGVLNDGYPVSRHSYQGQVYHAGRDTMLMLGGSMASGAGTADNRMWECQAGSTPTSPPIFTQRSGGNVWSTIAHALEVNPITDQPVYVAAGAIYQYDFTTDLAVFKASTLGTWGRTIAVDTTRNEMLIAGFWNGSDPFHAYIYDFNTETATGILFTGDLSIIQDVGVGLEYVASKDKYYLWSGFSDTGLFELDRTTLVITRLATTGVPPTSGVEGVWGRFAWDAVHHGFEVIYDWEENVKFIKLPV